MVTETLFFLTTVLIIISIRVCSSRSSLKYQVKSINKKYRQIKLKYFNTLCAIVRMTLM